MCLAHFKFYIAMSDLCIISFGNSEKYRLNLPEGSSAIDDIKSAVKSYLDDRYPSLAGIGYYDAMTVLPVSKKDAAEYKDYPEFSEESVRHIEDTLRREVEDYESVRSLNRNAPWNDVGPNP